MGVFALAYFLLNSWLVASRIAVDRHVSPIDVWRRSFIWLSVNHFCGASVAVLLVGNNRSIDVLFVGLVMPVLLVLHFTFKVSMQRIEDAYRHVEQVNTLYLSTIRTLAMAIDAKDQITHGHIRRVQVYAVGLARRLSITDESLIKAIEAAALLHDTGKLAIPEYILNKPGKLTPVEFDKMKEHADIGADILSAIDFPYPVVPIVRHHHENWDGTGYPDRLRGTDIPIGARILSVVDCFDALTSDRPYRPRLTDEAALKILNDRRGSMYDPLIVDVFCRVHREIAPDPSADSPVSATLDAIVYRPHRSTTFVDVDEQDGALTLFHHAARSPSTVCTCPKVTDRDFWPNLKEAIPFSLGIIFVNDPTTNELAVGQAFGDRASIVEGVTIPLGHRLSGWVAVNRQPILNSDARLDLGELASRASLRSCLSAPLDQRNGTVGVITLYSDSAEGFDERDLGVIQQMVTHVLFLEGIG
jgi:putative nucleotidyltransferase with HDIG domain